MTHPAIHKRPYLTIPSHPISSSFHPSNLPHVYAHSLTRLGININNNNHPNLVTTRAVGDPRNCIKVGRMFHSQFQVFN